jgi:flap endonuclease-1
MAAVHASVLTLMLPAVQVISGLGITSEQFVDVCILCGCDYAGTIRGIGAVRALQLVQKHGAPDSPLLV